MTDYYEENNSISKESQEKYLTFFLEKEEFAVNIAGIKEIIGVVKINKVPNTPTHIKGVINLRGKIIPVIDLRLKFEIPPVPYDETTCIIISEIKKNEKLLLTGLIVDSVSEVITIEPEDIENESLKENILKEKYIWGIAKTEDKGIKIVLNLEYIINENEILDLLEE